MNSNGIDTAANACSACKTQKRKCDRKLPKCSLCTRMSRDCIYAEMAQSSATAIEVLRSRVGQLEALLLQKHQMMEEEQARGVTDAMQSQRLCNSSVRLVNANPFEQFPALFFLDNELFQEAKMQIPKTSPPIPDDIYSMLGSLDGLRDIVCRFFTTIHTWFPILCSRRFELMLNVPSFTPSPDMALLFSAMRLITDEGSNCHSRAKTNAYWNVKNFSAVLETSAVMTPQLLQANIVINLYEIGHAIYPAAYLTVGKCVSLAKAMGLDNRKDAPQMLRRFRAWAEQEEVRRLWWAILLLDRYMHLGLTGHALATQDPPTTALLPSDDAQFDQAEIGPNEPLYVTTPPNIRTSPFARSCQAAHLAGKVIVLLNDFGQDSPIRYADALQLHRTLTTFVAVVHADFEQSPEEFATPTALAYSALIALCDPFCCSENFPGTGTGEGLELRTLCIKGVKAIADDIVRFALALRSSMNTKPAAMSPLIASCLYMGALTFAWRLHEGEKGTEKVDAYWFLRDVLSTVNGRWAVGGEYKEALDKAKELLYSTPLL